MSTPPPSLRADPRERFERLRERYTALPRPQRAGVMYAAALLFGLLVMPFLIWLAGSRVLGPYTHGQNTHAGPLALLSDYFVGLLHGSAVFWVVAAGPAVLLLLIRLFIALLRGLSGASSAADDED
ncbi:MAG TPA: hypothetical protein VEY89_11530 [Candidatus Dormibacteraeota bacterium]|nr:hypothetical protein [Candidatus Dormibacteraeota bacterium]